MNVLLTSRKMKVFVPVFVQSYHLHVAFTRKFLSALIACSQIDVCELCHPAINVNRSPLVPLTYCGSRQKKIKALKRNNGLLRTRTRNTPT